MSWKRIVPGISLFNPSPPHLTNEDLCYYAYEYKSWLGYSDNDYSRIVNFKKPSNVTGRPRDYRLEAIHHFANLIAETPFVPNTTITTAPTSKRKDDPEYNDRFDIFRRLLKSKNPDLHVVELFDVKESVLASHLGGTRDPIDIKENIITIDPLPNITNRLVIVDDVITKGGHFNALKSIAKEIGIEEVCGVFFAKTVQQNPFA